MKHFDVYVDGSNKGKTGTPGGWAYVIYENSIQKEYLSGSHNSTTNNRMEIQAVLSFLERSLDYKEPTSFEIYSDSMYVITGTKGRGLKKNLDLWAKLLPTLKQVKAMGHHLSFKWIKAHSGIAGNEKADSLAKLACNKEKYVPAHLKSFSVVIKNKVFPCRVFTKTEINQLDKEYKNKCNEF